MVIPYFVPTPGRSMSQLSLLAKSAKAFRLPSDLLRPLGGTTGNVFSSETLVVKIGSTSDIDREITATGPPEYDRARSASILALDPSVQRLVFNPLQAEFISGLSESARFAELESTDFTWACEFLLRDLNSRHSFEDLAPARDALVDSRAGRLGIFGRVFK
jgi:hypothetical protein